MGWNVDPVAADGARDHLALPDLLEHWAFRCAILCLRVDPEFELRRDRRRREEAESCSDQELWQYYATKHGSQPSDKFMWARSISWRMPTRIGSACSWVTLSHMHKRVTIIVGWAFALSVTPLLAQHEADKAVPKIEWLHSLDAALPVAQPDDRPVILYFTFDT